MKCFPGDPAIMCPALFKGSRSPLLLALLYIAYSTLCPYLIRRYLVFCCPCCVMLVGTALYICLLVYAGLSLFIICGLYVYMLVCVVYAYNLTIIYKFMTAKFKDEITSTALSKSATRGTAMLLTISFAFILLSGPFGFLNALQTSAPQFVFWIALAFEYVNHAINSLLYCMSGSRFRKELRKYSILVEKQSRY